MKFPLLLTWQDWQTIMRVGRQYSWSHAVIQCPQCKEGQSQIPEGAAHTLCREFETDTEGGHSAFPMLDHDSELYAKLMSFYSQVTGKKLPEEGD